MKKNDGFTLIELIMFILITSILASAILLAYVGSMGRSPSILQNTIATQTARQCAEWYVGQRRLKGYASVSGVNCPANLTIPPFCTTPSGYTLSGTCTQTTILGDSSYETITLSVTGLGNATLTLLFADY